MQDSPIAVGDYFDYHVQDHVAHLRMNRPAALNTMGPGYWRELETRLDALEHGAGVRALVLSSSGKHFSAGMALDVFGDGIVLDASSAAGRANIRTQLLDINRAFDRVAALRMPVIAAVQGGCVGGGLDLVATCDIRCCSADAFFCLQEINIGAMADLGSLQRLPRLIPDAVLREMAFTGRRLGAQRALASGLVNEVLPDAGAALAWAMDCAREIAAKAPVAIHGSKLSINYAREHGVRDAMEHMAILQSAVWDANNLVQSQAARKGGRAAQFEDLPAVPGFGG